MDPPLYKRSRVLAFNVARVKRKSLTPSRFRDVVRDTISHFVQMTTFGCKTEVSIEGIYIGQKIHVTCSVGSWISESLFLIITNSSTMKTENIQYPDNALIFI
jgi:hypothetical protein